MDLKFWGVRGSAPTPQIDNLGYGGNTPCVEIRGGGGELLIFDAGTGLRNLGGSLAGPNLSLNVWLTHYHWDHIQGLPFFAPLYRPDVDITFHASAHLGPAETVLRGQMTRPYFPVDFDRAGARTRFVEMDREPVRCGDLRIHAFPVNHPQGASGFRIESPGKVIVYATDLEFGDPRLDRVVRDYAQKADILIFDAQYTLEEYESRRGWGHSHWLEATNAARDAQAEQLILFHHDPWHNDQMVTAILDQARRRFENTLAAKED
ncbi:MAG: MBL fold metallo-hydrolase [Acidobacteria bacterium]|nr:MBL fold metallo-hydrolase [Acidobacteriota bacterium]MBI3472884.1 MBL fold metallo-hydrolase [Candidatus Solibacter usitatus]